MEYTDKEIEKRLKSTFGDRYYVYALCDDNDNIFYIGKGSGCRVLAHKNEIDKEQMEICKIKDPDEKQKREEELSRKKKKISEIEERKGTVKHVIIKYGLTENEAFMAESALINVLNYSGFDLCNIANGHASNQEVNSKAGVKTKARELHDFLDECALEELEADKIPKDILDHSIFISFRKLAPYCNNDPDIYWDAVRGEWKMSKKEAKKVKYIFAMSDAVIKAVFEVEPNNVIDILSENNDDIPNRPTAKAVHIIRDEEQKLGKEIAKIYKEGKDAKLSKQNIESNILEKCLELSKSAFDTDNVEEAKESLRKWMHRRYFTKRVKESEKKLNEKYANRILKEKNKDNNKYEDYKSPRGSIRYGSSFNK